MNLMNNNEPFSYITLTNFSHKAYMEKRFIKVHIIHPLWVHPSGSEERAKENQPASLEPVFKII
jgi:hypothetical protein